MVYGPLTYGGCGFPDFATEAGVAATALAMTHLRDFLETIDHAILVPTETEAKPAREGDVFIMDEILKHETNKTVLERINACRLFLRISEIATTDGRYLDEEFVTSTAQPSSNRLSWPQQQNPGPEGWRLFAKVMKIVFGTRKGTRNATLTLARRLGRWKLPLSEMDQIWEEAIDLATNALYRYNGIEWTVHESVQIERGSQRARRSRKAERWYSTEEKTTSDEIPPPRSQHRQNAKASATRQENQRTKSRWIRATTSHKVSRHT
jgi:hypothetical protein